ncbi:MAG: hypothetical protein HYV75_00325 [Opitutae bacterium]|nr:hypothetical protein [Opitutae bacterium]
MPAPEANDPVPTPVMIIQPCSEACAYFTRLATGGWSDYGVCTNPFSPFRGQPVRISQECRDYRAAGSVRQPRQA